MLMVLLSLWAGSVCMLAQSYPQTQGESADGGETLQKVLLRAMDALKVGDMQLAAEAFAQMEQDFANEKQYLADDIQRVVLPLAGYAYQMSGDTEAAIEAFKRFLDSFPNEPARRHFVLFALAQAYRSQGEPENAASTYGNYASEFAHRSESYIAQMRQADLLFEARQPEQAMEVLSRFYQSGAPLNLRMQARLGSLNQFLKANDFVSASEIVLNTSWSVETMPELAMLAFSAIRVGDYLSSQERYAEAIRAYRLVPPQEIMQDLQLKRLLEVKQEFSQRTQHLSPTESIAWNDYYGNLIGRLEGQLASLKEAEDYTPGLLLRYGTAYLQALRPWEAYAALESVALDESLPAAIRSDAHYRWILSAHQMEDWPEALRIALDFGQRYPESPLAPNALTLIADAYQQSRKHSEAIGVLTRLLEQYAGHALYPRWLFSRGYNNIMSSDNAAARNDFGAFEEKFPRDPLLANARYWRAQSHFFDKQYAEALAGYNAMLPGLSSHYLLPEVVYQRCSVLYAMRDYETALPAINDYLQQYPGHARAPEAQVLKGDIQMGRGQLLDAITAFRKVTPEAGNLFPYAIFQIGKIYRALEYYDKLIEHFNEYLAREDLEQKPRISEALYWIGWTYAKQDNIQAAFPVFLKAIRDYGNAPDAAEVPAILNQLQKLYQKRKRLSAAALPDIAGDMGMLTAENFDTWATSEREAAFARGELTWYARLSIYLAQEASKNKNTDAESLLYLQLAEKVPLEAMGAESLGRVGLALQKLEFPSAQGYFERLLDEYPNSPYRAMALYGMASYLQSVNKPEDALSQLLTLKRELPLHENLVEATMLHADLLAQLGRHEEGVQILEDLLRLKSARGRPHALALMQIGKIYETAGATDQAIPYYQRVYNLYRAYRDLAAQAYLASAKLFEEREDLKAALATYDELSSMEAFAEFPEYALAQKEAERLRPLVPAEPETPAMEETELP